MSDPMPPPEGPVSGWALGGLLFAASTLVITGAFQIVVGVTAIANGAFFVVGADYAFRFDTTAWGWIHLAIGIVMLAVAAGLFARASWGAVGGIVIAAISAIANFFFIPYYPFWAILVIALDAWVIWSLTSRRTPIER